MRSARFIRTAIGLALLTAVLPAPAATSSAAAAGPLRMTVGTLGAIGSLDPRHGDSVIAREVWNLEYPTLTSLDLRTLDPTTGTAGGWRPAPGGRGWIYSLRHGRTWSDGQPVTASDVVYSLDHARDEHWPYASAMLDGLQARALNASSVEITSTHGNGGLPSLLLHVVPAHVFSKAGDLSGNLAGLGVSDGLWHVTSATTDAVTLGVLGRPAGPPLDQIVFRTYPSADALISAIAHKDVDVVSGLPATEVARLEALPDVTVDHAPDGTQYELSFALGGATRDARLRRAISNAIDRTELVAKVVDGVGTPTVVPQVALGASWSLDAATVQALTGSLDAQPQLAKQLLAEAGRLARPLTLATPNDPESRGVGTFVRAALATAGIDVRTVDPNVGGTKADLTITRVRIGNDPSPVLAALTCDLCSALDARYRASTDLTTRLDLAHEMLQRATTQCTEIGLFEPDMLQAFRTGRLTGLQQYPEQPRLVVFGPTTQYETITAAHPPLGEQLSNTVYAIGAAVFLAVCIGAYCLAARLRRRFVT